MVAKRNGNGDEGRHRRVRKGGWNIVRKGGKNGKLETKSLKRGRHPKKWGNHQNFGIEAIEALKVSGNSDILMVNQKIYHNIKSANQL